MKDRNKILTQILIVVEDYNIEIIKINFTNINSITEEVEFTFLIEEEKFTISYIYKKDCMYEVNTAGCYIKCKLRELL